MKDKAKKDEKDNTVLYIIIPIASVILLVGAYVLYKYWDNRNYERVPVRSRSLAE
jgi:hypothetical protein